MTEMERYRTTYGEFNKDLSEFLNIVYQKVATRTAYALNYMTLIPKLLDSDDYEWITEDIDVVLRKTTDMFKLTKYVLRYLHAVIKDDHFTSWLEDEEKKLEKSMSDVQARLNKIKKDGTYHTETAPLGGTGGVNYGVRRDERIKIRGRLQEMLQVIKNYYRYATA